MRLPIPRLTPLERALWGTAAMLLALSGMPGAAPREAGRLWITSSQICRADAPHGHPAASTNFRQDRE